jgi:glycosyltransferase involved in cell wall biosynthesis
VKRKIAFIVFSFPKFSETFFLDEILDLKRRGLDIEIFSLVTDKKKIQSQANNLAGQIHYPYRNQPAFWAAQYYWLRHYPRVYARSWWKALCGSRHSLRSLFRMFTVVPAAAYFALLIKKYKVEHIHAYRATHPALAAYVISMLTGLPYSITARANDAFVPGSMLKEKLSGADFIITVSDSSRRMLSRYGPHIAEKTHVIPCGVNPDLFRIAVRRQNAFAPFTILCVAPLDTCNGHRYLIDACATLRQHGVNFRCLLVGDGPERRNLAERIHRLGLRDNVFLPGWQNREQIRKRTRNSDVFVWPGVSVSGEEQERIPAALMEAMAMEIPVVATSIPGIMELVEHGKSGLLVPQRNAAALAAAIYLMRQQPDSAREMAQAGKARVLNEFNLHMNCGKLYRIFCGMLREEVSSGIQLEAHHMQKQSEWAC